MSVPVFLFSPGELIRYGLKVSDTMHYQAPPVDLINATLQSGEGMLSDTGALVVKTGKFTGRSPKDRFIVKDHITTNTVNWNDINLPLEAHYFDIVFSHVTAYLNSQPELWVRDCYACADADYRLNIRIVNEKPWINLFAANRRRIGRLQSALAYFFGARLATALQSMWHKAGERSSDQL